MADSEVLLQALSLRVFDGTRAARQKIGFCSLDEFNEW
jgi:hypothetical protein